MVMHSPFVRKLVELSIEEDLGWGDLTSELSISPTERGEAHLIARDPVVMCGGEIVECIAAASARPLQVLRRVRDGSSVRPQTALVVVRGRLIDLLALERVLLNFLQRLCAIATTTRTVVAHADGLQVLDTRKTTPGWRILEKYAVRVGGGANHRIGLGDMILVKNNHIDSVGILTKTLERIMKRKSPYVPVEVEVRNLEELKEALPFRPTAIMFDNMTDSEIKRGVTLVRKVFPECLLEVSGGVTIARLEQLKALGINTVSMGALTTQPRAVDIAARIRRIGTKQR